jgi:hypothetical protein
VIADTEELSRKLSTAVEQHRAAGFELPQPIEAPAHDEEVEAEPPSDELAETEIAAEPQQTETHLASEPQDTEEHTITTERELAAEPRDTDERDLPPEPRPEQRADLRT